MSESEGRKPAGRPGSESAPTQARRLTEGVCEGVDEEATSNEAAAAPSSGPDRCTNSAENRRPGPQMSAARGNGEAGQLPVGRAVESHVHPSRRGRSVQPSSSGPCGSG